jgi:hypothetical protein
LAFVLATARRRTSPIYPDPFLYQVKCARLSSVWADQTHGSKELFLLVDRLRRCDVAPTNERKRQAACSAPDIQDLFAIFVPLKSRNNGARRRLHRPIYPSYPSAPLAMKFEAVIKFLF